MTVLDSYITVNDLPVLDPLTFSKQARARGISDSVWFEKANSVTIPRGPEPTEAHLLLSYEVLDQLQGTSTITFIVEGDDSFIGADRIHVRNMYLHATEAVLAPYDNTESAYLATFRGPREIAKMSSINKSYNVTTPYYADREPPSDTTIDYYDSTTNSGSPWTWQEALDDIWAMLPGMGTVDYSRANMPSSTWPINYRFQGQSAWDAYLHFLIDLGNYIVPDVYGSTDGNPRWLVVRCTYDTNDAERKPWDDARTVPTSMSHPRQQIPTRVPEKVKVFFPSQNYGYQFQADTSVVNWRDAINADPNHEIEIDSNATNAVPGTVVSMRDATPAYYDVITGDIMNEADLQSIAQYMADEYVSQVSGIDKNDYYSGLHRLFPYDGISMVEFFDFGVGLQTRIRRQWRGHGRPQHESDTVHWHPEEAKEIIPYHRQAYVKVMESLGSGSQIINPGEIGRGELYWWNVDAKEWTEVNPAKSVYFYNVGLGAIDLTAAPETWAYLEYWWQSKTFVTFCGFQP